MRLSTENKTLQDNFGNFPFICSNIPIPPADDVYLSQLVRRYNVCDIQASQNKIKINKNKK
jgi:hypothetical protein